jgi:hypothetical protein
VLLVKGGGMMSGGQRWSVEVKEFEMVVRTGASRVRIF